MNLIKSHPEYNYSIALLRIFATISVVVGHLAADSVGMVALFKFIYSYHIPLFAFISGYLYFYSMRHYSGFGDMLA